MTVTWLYWELKTLLGLFSGFFLASYASFLVLTFRLGFFIVLRVSEVSDYFLYAFLMVLIISLLLICMVTSGYYFLLSSGSFVGLSIRLISYYFL